MLYLFIGLFIAAVIVIVVLLIRYRNVTLWADSLVMDKVNLLTDVGSLKLDNAHLEAITLNLEHDIQGLKVERDNAIRNLTVALKHDNPAGRRIARPEREAAVS